MDNNKFNVKSVFQHSVLILASIVIIFPLLFIVLASLKTQSEIFLSPFSLPQNPDFSIYKTLLIEKGFVYNILNSLFYAVTTVVVSAMVCYLGAYAISRMKWKLSKVVLALLLLGLMVPQHSMVLPLYVVMQKIGIDSPRISLILVFTAFAIPRTIFIFVGFLQDISRSMEEAAIIDGASIWKVIFMIILPMIKPALATVCIFNFLQVWNDLFIGLIFITDNAQKTIQLGLLQFQGLYETQYNILLAAVSVAIIPIMVVYAFFQKNIIKGITAGAIKG